MFDIVKYLEEYQKSRCGRIHHFETLQELNNFIVSGVETYNPEYLHYLKQVELRGKVIVEERWVYTIPPADLPHYSKENWSKLTRHFAIIPYVYDHFFFKYCIKHGVDVPEIEWSYDLLPSMYELPWETIKTAFKPDLPEDDPKYISLQRMLDGKEKEFVDGVTAEMLAPLEEIKKEYVKERDANPDMIWGLVDV